MREPADGRDHEALLGAAAAAAGAAVLVCDDTLRYVAANSTACKLLGYTRDQLLQLRVADVVERASGGLLDAVREVVAGKIRHGTVGVRRKDGQSFPVQYVSVPTSHDGVPHVLTLLW
ncbi:MAG TPA: PAS domain-containing protein [Gaiellaceae bacterium]|nr:PAS domain-containing protein [Gaiellaceae bacterium]